MNRQLMEWKLGVEQLCEVAALDYREAERLAADIVTRSADATLRSAAAKALPSLRNASLQGADRSTQHEAQRRFSAIRDMLRELDPAGLAAAASRPRR